MIIKQYAGPLTVLGAGAIGFSFFLIVAAAALTDPRTPTESQINLEPQNIVDSAVSNINTMAALTVESVSQYIPTATITPSPSNVPTDAESPTYTATVRPTRTRLPPTRTREPSDSLPRTATSVPTLISTTTSLPTLTDTPLPTFTETPDPPTNTPDPTDTPVPTDTPEPEPTNTDEPLPTLQLPADVPTAES